MKVVGHVHTKHNLEPARRFEIGTIVECECGDQFVNKGGVGILGPFQYWDNYKEAYPRPKATPDYGPIKGYPG